MYEATAIRTLLKLLFSQLSLDVLGVGYGEGQKIDFFFINDDGCIPNGAMVAILHYFLLNKINSVENP